MQNTPVLAYFGHHKCGTRWVLSIIAEVCDALSLKWAEYHNARMFNNDLAATICDSGVQFVCYTNANYSYVKGLQIEAGFHVIRDPRDILVSAYFSHLYSHPTTDWPDLAKHRERLQKASKEDGLILEMGFLKPLFQELFTWDYEIPSVLELKMEDLIQNPYEGFTRIFTALNLVKEHPRAERSVLPEDRLLAIVHRNQFSKKARGRNRGDEDVTSHYRKGVSGDWVNHFTQDHVSRFKDLFNPLLLKTRYEHAPNWSLESSGIQRARDSSSHQSDASTIACIRGELFEKNRLILDLKTQVGRQTSEIEKLKTENAEKEKRIDELQVQAAESKRFIDSLRVELARLQQGKAPIDRQAQNGESRSDQRAVEYRNLIVRIRQMVERVLPHDTMLSVITKGDDELLSFGDRKAFHFPQSEDGGYMGYHPAESTEAINQLEAACARGIEFLLFPCTAFWWLDHYHEFRQFLENQFTLLAYEEGTCAIFALRKEHRKAANLVPKTWHHASVLPEIGLVEDMPERRDRADNKLIRSLLAVSLAPDSNCVDVGAHKGMLLREFIRIAPRGHHIAFEPLPHLHAQLIKEFPQADVRCAALSDRTGKVSFIHVKTQPGYSGFLERSYPGNEETELITVDVESLDRCLPAGYVPRLIKIDVEGAERQVIQGAINTITAHKPIVLFEHGRGAADHYGTTPSDIFELLCTTAGLRIFDLEGSGPFNLEAFTDVFDKGSCWNFVAHL